MRYGSLFLSLLCGNCAAQQWNLGIGTTYSPKNKNWQHLGYLEFYQPLQQRNKLELGVYGKMGTSLGITPDLFGEAGLRFQIQEPISGIPGKLTVSAGFAEWCQKKQGHQAELKQDFFQSLAFTTMASFRVSYDIPITRNISIGPFFELWGKIAGNGMFGNSICCAPVVGLSIVISLHRRPKVKEFYSLKNWLYENPPTLKELPKPLLFAEPLAHGPVEFWKP